MHPVGKSPSRADAPWRNDEPDDVQLRLMELARAALRRFDVGSIRIIEELLGEQVMLAAAPLSQRFWWLSDFISDLLDEDTPSASPLYALERRMEIYGVNDRSHDEDGFNVWHWVCSGGACAGFAGLHAEEFFSGVTFVEGIRHALIDGDNQSGFTPLHMMLFAAAYTEGCLVPRLITALNEHMGGDAESFVPKARGFAFKDYLDVFLGRGVPGAHDIPRVCACLAQSPVLPSPKAIGALVKSIQENPGCCRGSPLDDSILSTLLRRLVLESLQAHGRETWLGEEYGLLPHFSRLPGYGVIGARQEALCEAIETVIPLSDIRAIPPAVLESVEGILADVISEQLPESTRASLADMTVRAIADVREFPPCPGAYSPRL